jgi:hypothetical protein
MDDWAGSRDAVTEGASPLVAELDWAAATAAKTPTAAMVKRILIDGKVVD